MSDFDTVISGGQIVTVRGIQKATLALRNGRIAGLLDPSIRVNAGLHLSADGLHILPGLIDTHVHLRSPGNTEREDPISGTSAAAAGGITTLLEMPISLLPSNSAEGLQGRANAIAEGALIDFGLYGAAGFQNIDRIAEIADAGAVAFKTFLTPPPAHREGEFFGLWCLDYADLRDVMFATAKTGLRHTFHCENFPMIETFVRRLSEAGRTDGLAHAESRPAIVEDTSVALMMSIAAETGGPVEVVHLSSPRAGNLVKEAKTRGLDVIAETCPQYLFLTSRVLEEQGGLAKCNPALRSEAEREALWPYLFDGTLDFVGSDHSPFLFHEKQGTDIFKIPPGVPGLESMTPMMLTAVNEGRLSLCDLVRLMSTRAAEVFRLPGKGDIAVGCDADLTFVDLSARWTFDRHACFSKSRESMTVAHGMPVHGRVVRTMVRGVTVYHEGQITASPGHGRWIKGNSAPKT
ncbi:MAG: amidohydrolase family protein [candidate division Zixibacteria bacterium]|nr:amidohydrolase family protein [candidate division Zixibacteria bacterium]